MQRISTIPAVALKLSTQQAKNYARFSRAATIVPCLQLNNNNRVVLNNTSSSTKLFHSCTPTFQQVQATPPPIKASQEQKEQQQQQQESDSNQDKNEKLSIKDRIKRFIRNYGITGLIVYFSIYYLTWAGFYFALEHKWINPGDVTELAKKIGLDRWIDLEGDTQKKVANVGAAYLITKLTEPLRFGATVMITPFVLKLFRKIVRK